MFLNILKKILVFLAPMIIAYIFENILKKPKKTPETKIEKDKVVKGKIVNK